MKIIIFAILKDNMTDNPELLQKMVYDNIDINHIHKGYFVNSEGEKQNYFLCNEELPYLKDIEYFFHSYLYSYKIEDFCKIYDIHESFLYLNGWYVNDIFDY